MKRTLVLLVALAMVCSLAGVAFASVITDSSRSHFNSLGAIYENYGFDDFGSDFTYPGDPWTAHGVTYTSANNIIVGTATSYSPISNIICNNYWTPLTANIDAAAQYTMFGLDLSYLGDYSEITFTVYTNLGSYVYSGIDAPIVSRSMDFYGFIASGEYFTGFRLDSGSGTAPCADNVTLGKAGASVPEPASMLLLGLGLIGLAGIRKKF